MHTAGKEFPQRQQSRVTVINNVLGDSGVGKTAGVGLEDLSSAGFGDARL